MQFAKGRSGNPGGRRPLTAEARKVQRFFEDKSMSAAKVLVGLMENGKTSPAIRHKCAQTVLDYGIGKAMPMAMIDEAENFELLPQEQQLELLLQRMSQYQVAIAKLRTQVDS